MKRILSMLLTFTLLCSLSACGGTGDSSGDFSAEGSAVGSAESSAAAEEAERSAQQEEQEAAAFGVGYYKGEGMNPYTCDNAQNQTLVGLVYESLFELDESFTAQPCLAKSVTAKTKTVTSTVETGEADTSGAASSADASGSSAPATKTVQSDVTSVTVELRDDVNFSDGSGFHADDVAASLQRAARKDSVYYNRLSGVSNIKTSGKSKVTFEMEGSSTNVAELLDIPIVKAETVDDLFPVGTGAYTVQRSKSGLPTSFTANSGWWRKSAEGVTQPLQAIQVYTAEDSDDLIFGFSSSNVTIVSTDFTGIDALSYTGSYTIDDYNTTELLYLGCNTEKGSSCHDQQLRYAIYRAVDRDTIVSRQLAGHATAAALPVSVKSPFYNETMAEELDYQLDTAKSLCAAAGTSSTLRLIVNKDSSFKVGVASEVARELEAAGLSVQTDVLSWKDFTSALKKGEYDLYLGEVKLSANFDLSPLIARDGSLNYSGYSNSTLQKAMKSFNCTTGDERTVAAETYFTAFTEQAPVIPLCFKSRSVLTREGSVLKEASTQSNLFYHFWEWNISSAVVEKSSAG